MLLRGKISLYFENYVEAKKIFSQFVFKQNQEKEVMFYRIASSFQLFLKLERKKYFLNKICSEQKSYALEDILSNTEQKYLHTIFKSKKGTKYSDGLKVYCTLLAMIEQDWDLAQKYLVDIEKKIQKQNSFLFPREFILFYELMGIHAYKIKKYSQAVSFFYRCIKLEPWRSYLYHFRAISRAKKWGNEEDIIKDCMMAIKIEPGNFVPFTTWTAYMLEKDNRERFALSFFILHTILEENSTEFSRYYGKKTILRCENILNIKKKIYKEM